MVELTTTFEVKGLEAAQRIVAADAMQEALEPLVLWLGVFLDQGEQVGNLDMRYVAKARTALRQSRGQRALDEDSAMVRDLEASDV